MRYSVIVPTYNHCDDLLKPCIESIIKYTDLSEIELIVVANGCTDNTDYYLEYVESMFRQAGCPMHFLYDWSDEPLGYAAAINRGLNLVNSDKVILLNNDTVLLDQPKNQWLDIFDEPFHNPACGISCIIKNQEAGHDFAVFFAVAIRCEVFTQIGTLDESFGVGGGEDIDFCIRAQLAGWKIGEVFEKHWNGKQFTGGFPVYHAGEGTVKHIPGWDKIFHKNMLEIAKRYNREHYKFLLSNDYERAVFLKGDPVFAREAARYEWAAQHLRGHRILEIGCSTGYGRQFLPADIDYLGVDYDAQIVEVAKEQNWGGRFAHADINTMALGGYGTIIAFEVIEHLPNGLEVIERLKKHCNNLIISVPLNEPPGFWGHHHCLHGLNESHFTGAEFWYIDQDGVITKDLNPDAKFNLLLCRWTNG
jgi:glycosyltransferase involved in cell wall biosynthesis